MGKGQKKAMLTSQAQRTVRVQQVFTMMCECKSTATIVKTIMEQHGVKRNTVEAYIRGANKELKEMYSAQKEDKVAKAIAQRENVIEKLTEQGNYAMVSQALADKAKLEGLYEKEQQETTIVIPTIHLHQVTTMDEVKKIG